MDKVPVKGWNFAPSVPIQVSPIFTWPWKPYEIVKWIWNSWFLITEKLIVLGLAVCSFYWLQPPLNEMKNLSFDWVLLLYFRNMALMIGVAGALHLYFYTFSKQGEALKYDKRPLMKNGKQFTLGGQIRDNMFWTLGSGVTI